jgi:hypothetical protein
MARRTPVVMKGSAAGMTILVKICASPWARALRQRDLDQPAADIAHAAISIDDDRKEARQEDDHDLGQEPEPEPQDEQGNESDIRRGIEGVDLDVEQLVDQPVAPHQQAEQRAKADRRRQPDREPENARHEGALQLAGRQHGRNRAQDRGRVGQKHRVDAAAVPFPCQQRQRDRGEPHQVAVPAGADVAQKPDGRASARGVPRRSRWRARCRHVGLRRHGAAGASS